MDYLIIALKGNCNAVNSELPANSPSRNLAALWIRAAFHDMGTLDLSNTSFPGGPDATLVYTTNLNVNMGLKDSIANLFVTNTSLASKADLIALGGLVSVKHCGGPDVSFRGGRKDVAPAAVVLSNSQRLPGGNEPWPSVQAKMIRMGFSPVDIAVLGGSLLCRCSRLY